MNKRNLFRCCNASWATATSTLKSKSATATTNGAIGDGTSTIA